MSSDTGKQPFDLPFMCETRGDQELVELARSYGLGPKGAEAVAVIDAVMTKVRRSIQRREFGRRIIAKIDPTLDVGHLDAITAIAYNAVWSDRPDDEVTVGQVAERLGIDPSRASRVVADVVERGYARRVASQQDARRICLELTVKGQRFVDAVRINKWQVFARALGQWNERELVVFAALLERFQGWATDEDRIEHSAQNIKRILEESDEAEDEVVAD